MHRNDARTAQYVTQLAGTEAASLGFLPGHVYAAAVAAGRISVAEENGEPCGYLFRGPWRPETKIYQTVVTPDLRLQRRAAELWHQLVDGAATAGVEAITLHCACDLSANKFWRTLGLIAIARRAPRTATRRWAWRYRWMLPKGEDLERYVQAQAPTGAAARAVEMFGMRDRLANYHRRRGRSR